MKCQRHILLPCVYNFRDLGGYPAKDDKITKWGLVYRTDSLAGLTEEGWAGLEDLGVCCIIDLRSAREREEMPVKPLYPLDYEGFSLMGDSKYGPAPTPVLDDEEDDETDQTEALDAEGSSSDASKEFMKSTRLDYTATLFTHMECAVDIMDAILSVLKSGKGSLAYMCTAGKDRTGIVSAILLYLCGVPDEDIIADYMVSSVYNTNGVNKKMEDLVKSVMKTTSIDSDLLKRNMGSEPGTMRRLLNSFRKRDLRKALADNGFGEEKQKMIAELMTE